MSSNKPLPTDPSKLKTVSNGRLLGEYDPRQPQTPVAQELKSRWGNRPVVAFNQDGSVAVVESNAYMDELNLGEDPMDMIYVQGQLSKVYPIGEAPSTMRPEDPLTPGKTLRGTTEQSVTYNVTFQGVSQEARQFMRVMLDMQGQPGVPNLKSPFELDQVMALARTGLAALQQKFPAINVRYQELARARRLPPLLIEKGGSQPGAAPFAAEQSPTAPAASQPSASVLDYAQRQQMTDVLIGSFSRDEVGQVFQVATNRGYYVVVQPGTLTAELNALIEYLVQKNQVIQFLQAARAKNPDNIALKQFADSLGVPEPLPRRPTRWDGKTLGILSDRIRETFSPEELQAKYKATYNGRLEDQAQGSNYTAQVNNLVWWAQRTGQLEILAGWVTWG